MSFVEGIARRRSHEDHLPSTNSCIDLGLDNSSSPTKHEATTATAHLQEWINAQGCLEPDSDESHCRRERLSGALRLLYFPWPSSDENYDRILPFSEHSFALLQRQIGLPRCFLGDFSRPEATPTRFEDVPNSRANKLGKSRVYCGAIKICS